MLPVCRNDFDGTYDCCWINTQNTEGDNIRFQTRISFVPRTDSPDVINGGEINQSPVADMVPLLPARVGCEFKMIIPNADPDFDDVKCRWALNNTDPSKDECGAACIDKNKEGGLFNATLVEASKNIHTCIVFLRPLSLGRLRNHMETLKGGSLCSRRSTRRFLSDGRRPSESSQQYTAPVAH